MSAESGSGSTKQTKATKGLNSYQVFFKEQRDKGLATKEVQKMWKQASEEFKAEYKARADKINAGEPIVEEE